MQNSSSRLPGFSRPISIKRSCERPIASRSGPRCSSIKSALNRSWPAGTGVCVVKTTSRATSGNAASKLRPFFLHAIVNRFENDESAVAFVEMQHAGRDAHRFQRAESADAEQQFLADTNPAIAAIQVRRQLAIFRRVGLDVGIEQQQIATSNFHAPHARANRTSARIDLHLNRLAVRADRRLHRKMIHVILGVLFLLPTFIVEALAEISLAVEQADSDERNVEVGRALDVIAGQNSEAAGINWNRFVQAELRRKICDRPRPQNAGVARAPRIADRRLRYSRWRRYA